MPTARVNGVDLHYVEAGDGVPVVVLHGGLGLDHSLYKASFGPLEDALRLVYLDQRGNGRSERPPLETITIPQLAEDVDGFRAHLGLERLGVMGHSYGGFVALEYATRFPDRVSHLVAVATSPGAFDPTPEELAERADPSWVTQEVRSGLDAFAAGPPATNEEFAAQMAAMAPAYLRTASPDVLSRLLESTILDAAVMARGFEALRGWSVEARLDRVSAPTLVLCGRCDLFTTPECSKRIASRVSDAELVWFEHSGHFPWLDEPDPFFAVVESFFARRP